MLPRFPCQGHRQEEGGNERRPSVCLGEIQTTYGSGEPSSEKQPLERKLSVAD